MEVCGGRLPDMGAGAQTGPVADGPLLPLIQRILSAGNLSAVAADSTLAPRQGPPGVPHCRNAPFQAGCDGAAAETTQPIWPVDAASRLRFPGKGEAGRPARCLSLPHPC